MTDIESALARYLHERASSVDARPDLERVMSTYRQSHDHRPRGRRLAVVATISAAALLLMALVVVVVHDGTAFTPSSRTGPLPANGVIVFSGSGGLAQVDPDGKGRTLTLPSIDIGTHVVSWAPDGQRFVYADGARIYVADLVSHTTRLIWRCNPGFCEVAWSPDGSVIAVTDGTGISLVDPDGPSDQPGRSVAIPDGDPTNLNWTPDSQRIVFRVSLSQGGHGIESISRDGNHRTTIAPITRNGTWLDYFGLALSPDGSTLAWIGSRDGTEAVPTELELMTMNIDGTGTKTVRDLGVCFCLGGTPGLTWSPDGKQLAFIGPLIKPNEPPSSQSPPAQFTVQVFNADGSDLRSLGVAGNGRPSWQPTTRSSPT